MVMNLGRYDGKTSGGWDRLSGRRFFRGDVALLDIPGGGAADTFGEGDFGLVAEHPLRPFDREGAVLLEEVGAAGVQRRLDAEGLADALAGDGGLLRAVGVYLARPGLLARVFLLAILLHLVRVAGAMAIAWGLGMQVGFTTLMIVISVGVILSMLPLTPQGLGTREIAYVAMLASLGVPAAQATALSLLFTGTTAVVVLLPTLWFYLRFGIWGNPAPVSRNDRSV